MFGQEVGEELYHKCLFVSFIMSAVVDLEIVVYLNFFSSSPWSGCSPLLALCQVEAVMASSDFIAFLSAL